MANKKNEDPMVRELQQIRNLMVLSLIKQGATSDEINAVIGGNIRDSFPMRKFKRGIVIVANKQ